MQIMVERFNDIIFEGDDDDFLFDNDSDIDLEMALNDLEEMKVGSTIKVYNGDGDTITITKGTLIVYD